MVFSTFHFKTLSCEIQFHPLRLRVNLTFELWREWKIEIEEISSNIGKRKVYQATLSFTINWYHRVFRKSECFGRNNSDLLHTVGVKTKKKTDSWFQIVLFSFLRRMLIRSLFLFWGYLMGLIIVFVTRISAWKRALFFVGNFSFHRSPQTCNYFLLFCE